MRVVLDTNILVSGLLQPKGLPALVLLLAFAEQFDLYISPAVLAEYEEVLHRPKLRLEAREIDTTLKKLREIGQLVRPIRTLQISSHESDNRLYECAQAAQADYLVTGNRRHFTKELPPTKIVNARELLEKLENEIHEP